VKGALRPSRVTVRDVRAREVIGEAWAFYKVHWRHLLPLAAAFYLIIAIVTLLLTLAFGALGAVVAAVGSLVGYFWLAGALTEAVADIRDGRADLSLQETFSRVWPRVWTLLGAGLLAGLGISLGLVLLIVPGLILLTWWALISPAVVLERRGVIEAFGRSRELVRGYGWSVFVIVILTVLISFAIGIAVSLALIWLPDEVRSFVGGLVNGTLTAPFVALAWTLTYFRLKELRQEPQAAPAAPIPA
jgi:hypothetical protein